MTLEEALAAIRAEGLGDYRWFEDATNDTDIVAIQRTESGWVVFATDERATPQGRREFTEEGPALENFLSRLRSNNSVRAWHEEIRHEKPADPPVSGQFCRPAGYPRKRGTERAPSDRPA